MDPDTRQDSVRSDRRGFLRTATFSALAGGLAGAVNASGYQTTHHPTPSEIQGPFYPVHGQKDKDFDLTRIEGKDGKAEGEVAFIIGRVLDTAGEPIEDATVEIWQANAAGRYRHPHDPNDAPLDEHFQGWAIVPSGKQGGFRFKTIIPGTYPVSDEWTRPPHIHFKVAKRGYVELITQMYFPGHDLNDVDRLLQRKSEAERKLMVARKVEAETPTFEYVIYLEKA